MKLGSDEFGRWLRGAAGLDPDDCTDAALIARYLSADDAAFEALVRRHARTVLGVCTRTLGSRHDAEDVFQATFLELVRRAASLTRYESVGGWLYQTAYHAALNARRTRGRRAAREARAARPEAAAAAALLDDEVAVLVEEIARLPARYREAVVLCELEGKSRDEAARRAGVPVGTLSGRLTTARRVLRDRLERRGVTAAPATLVGLITAAGAASAVPAGLVRATAAVAAAGVGPAGLARLWSGGAALMSLAKCATPAVVAGVLTWFVTTAPQPKAAPLAAPEGKPAAKTEPAGANEFVASRTWAVTAVDAEKGTLSVTERPAPAFAGQAVAAFAVGGPVQLQGQPLQLQFQPVVPAQPLPVPVPGAPGGAQGGVFKFQFVQPGVVGPPMVPALDPLTLTDLKLAGGAAVTLDGKPAKLADLKPGVVAALEAGPGGVVRVTALTAPAPAGYKLTAVDLKARRVTITAGEGTPRMLPLAKAVKVVCRTMKPDGNGGLAQTDEAGTVEDLTKKVGGAVGVQLGMENGAVVVTAVQTN